MSNSIPIQAYSPWVRDWLLPLYERGGVSRIQLDGMRYQILDPAGKTLQDLPIAAYRWSVPTRIKLVRHDNTMMHAKIRMWRLFASQESQITFYEGEWPALLAHLDSYDLNRNPEWPFKRGAVWLPRNKGCSWYMFLESIQHWRQDMPWPYLADQLKPYEPILMKYGDRLDFLLKKET